MPVPGRTATVTRDVAQSLPAASVKRTSHTHVVRPRWRRRRLRRRSCRRRPGGRSSSGSRARARGRRRPSPWRPSHGRRASPRAPRRPRRARRRAAGDAARRSRPERVPDPPSPRELEAKCVVQGGGAHASSGPPPRTSPPPAPLGRTDSSPQTATSPGSGGRIATVALTNLADGRGSPRRRSYRSASRRRARGASARSAVTTFWSATSTCSTIVSPRQIPSASCDLTAEKHEPPGRGDNGMREPDGRRERLRVDQTMRGLGCRHARSLLRSRSQADRGAAMTHEMPAMLIEIDLVVSLP